VVVESKWFSLIPMNEWGGKLFDPTTTPALRATPPVPRGELFLPLLQFIHTSKTAHRRGIDDANLRESFLSATPSGT